MKRAFDSVLKAGASRPAPAYLRDHHRTIAWVAAGVSLVYAAVAVAFKIYEYADGSWFSFALVSGHPFQLIWREYAGRLAAYGLYVAPAQALMRLGTAPRLALDVYASLYYLTPVASLCAAYGLLSRAERWRIVWPALFFLTLGVLTWGFPTEIWLTSAGLPPLGDPFIMLVHGGL